ncbi:MAG: hypothetical protein QFX40_00360 [Archaeoglobales archaeon]|nr:hypothetical protein [Archaeoglobales archaeon]
MPNRSSKRLLEILIVVVLMLLPFLAPKNTNILVFVYWNLLAAIYLLYISFRRWELE